MRENQVLKRGITRQTIGDQFCSDRRSHRCLVWLRGRSRAPVPHIEVRARALAAPASHSGKTYFRLRARSVLSSKQICLEAMMQVRRQVRDAAF